MNLLLDKIIKSKRFNEKILSNLEADFKKKFPNNSSKNLFEPGYLIHQNMLTKYKSRIEAFDEAIEIIIKETNDNNKQF